MDSASSRSGWRPAGIGFNIVTLKPAFATASVANGDATGEALVRVKVHSHPWRRHAPSLVWSGPVADVQLNVPHLMLLCNKDWRVRQNHSCCIKRAQKPNYSFRILFHPCRIHVVCENPTFPARGAPAPSLPFPIGAAMIPQAMGWGFDAARRCRMAVGRPFGHVHRPVGLPLVHSNPPA